MRNKWKPREIDKKAVNKDLDAIIFLCGRIGVDLERESILVDVDYSEVADLVDGLYNKMDIGSLAQDNKRRADRDRKKSEQAKGK